MADKKLTDYLTIEFQIKLQKAISFATGFGVAFTNADGVHVGKLEQFCEFCSKINNTTEGVRLCECTNRNAINMAIETGQPAIYICHAGLVNIEIPIIYEDKCLGAITAGNVLCKDTEQFPRDEMDSSLFWKNNSELSAAYDQIPVVTKQQVIGMMETLTTMTNYIINEISYSQTQQALLRSEAIRLQLEQQLKVAQLDALQKQVAPHFLFNVLNTVSRLISLQEQAAYGRRSPPRCQDRDP
jgi:two-component system LytT family sensor kinase